MEIPYILKPVVVKCYFIPEGGHQQEMTEKDISFDDMNALKLYCLRHPYAINMPALINKNCKVCYGTGRNGNIVGKGILYCYKCLVKNFKRKLIDLLEKRQNEQRNKK